MSLNRYLYLVNMVKMQQGMQMKILNSFEFEGTVMFSLFEKEDGDLKSSMISIAHEQDKFVKFYSLFDLL